MKHPRALFLLLCLSCVYLLCGCGSSLSGAAVSGDLALAKQMIQQGEDPNQIDKYGWTPLMWAAYYNQPDIVSFLLENGAKPNVRCTNQYGTVPPGSTALIMAAYYNHVQVVELLLKGGADPDVVNRAGYTAIKYAREYGFSKVEKLLSN
jgi:ankyrin repeat protein